MRIPAPVIAVLGEVLEEAYTHATMNTQFLHAGAPGDPPEGVNKEIKVQQWLKRTNRDEPEPLKVLGLLIEEVMEADFEHPSQGPTNKARHDKIAAALKRCELRYIPGGIVSGGLGPASKNFEELIRGRNIPALDDEFGRALRNVESNPREAVSAACNTLESVCKVLIADEGLDLPAKQDLQGVWGVVRKHLKFDPAAIEDRDLKEILSGLFAVVGGIGALRTHASSAHGAGKTVYRLEARHARLAVHAAHTLTAFIIESWDKKRSAG